MIRTGCYVAKCIFDTSKHITHTSEFFSCLDEARVNVATGNIWEVPQVSRRTSSKDALLRGCSKGFNPFTWENVKIHCNSSLKSKEFYYLWYVCV